MRSLRFSTLVLSLALACMPVLRVVADDQTEKLNAVPKTPQNTPENAAQILNSLGITKDNPLYPRLFERITAPTEDGNTALPVTKHIRGHDGEDLPVKSEPTPRAGPSEDMRAAMQQYTQRFNASSQKFLASYQRVPEMMNCKENKTEQKLLAETEDPKSKEIIRDSLFIRSENAALDPELVYGKKVRLFKFHTDRPNTDSFTAIHMKVPCLPYRIRLTGRMAYYDYGTNALMNYDEDPKGKIVEGQKGKL